MHQMAPPARANALTGTIAYTVYLGTSTEYEVQLADGIRLRVNRADAERDPLLREGEGVVVSWAAEDSIVLPGSRESMAGWCVRAARAGAWPVAASSPRPWRCSSCSFVIPSVDLFRLSLATWMPQRSTTISRW